MSVYRRVVKNSWAGFNFHDCWKKSFNYSSRQIIATSHDLGPQKVANGKGNGTPYFRKIQVGEMLEFGKMIVGKRASTLVVIDL